MLREIRINTAFVLMIVASTLSLMPLLLAAQGVFSPQIAFKHLTIDNGLPQNTVTTIAQDKHGFLWFGTQDGLCRYDGYTMKTFRHDRTKKNSIRNSYASCLLFDRKERLWVGTAGGGLNLYNPVQQQFTAFLHDGRDEKSLSDNRIRALCEDFTGKIWVGTERGGLNLFDPKTGKVKRFLHDASNLKTISGNRIFAITYDADKTLWVATVGGGLCYFNPKDSSFVRVVFEADNNGTNAGVWKPLTGLFSGTINRQKPENTNVSEIYADKEGTLWVGTRGAGMLRVDVRRGRWQRILFARNSPMTFHSVGQRSVAAVQSASNFTPNSASNDIVSICPDHNGRLWVGLEGGGVSIYDPSSGMNFSYKHDPLNPLSLSDNVVRTIFCDNVATVWVGTATGGVNKYASGAHRFSVFRHEPMNPRSLSANVVRAFAEDREGAIWVGMVDGGLNRFIRKEGAFERHRYAPCNDTALGNEDVWGLAADADGTVWVGTQNGLFAYNPKKKTSRVYRHNPQDPLSLSSNIIRCLHIDREGTLWIGTNLGGICRFDKRTEKFTAYHFFANDSLTAVGTVKSSDPIRSILHASDGTLWVGTVNLGVLAFDKERGEVKAAYRHNERNDGALESNELSNNTVRHLSEDRRGNIWAGTLDGLNCISPQRATVRTITESDGLPNEVIYGITEDKAGMLWLATNKGLVRFQPDKNAFKSYTKQDGLQNDEFNGNAILRGSDGWIYVGGISGFNTFHPDSIRENGRVPPVIITNCKVFGKSLELDTAITERTTLRFPHSYSNCTFEFVALNFIGAEKNQYRYILEGFDNEWVEAGTRREAIYTNLEPGEYIFRVQGSNNDGIWNMQGATLHLTITPPWWGTWYFRLGMAVAVIAFGAGIYRARVYAFRVNARRLENLVQVRTQVLTETNQRLANANEEIQRQMTHQYEQAQELQRAYMRLDEANDILITRNHELLLLNNEKNELLAIVSHDLRNPLVSTLLAIKLLQKRFPHLSDEEKFAYLAKIQGASEQMIDFITKLLDVNALETGKMPVSLVPCNVRITAEAILENYQSRALTKHMTFHFETTEKPIILADAVLLPQVLDNLVSNALKYSPPNREIYLRIASNQELILTDDSTTNPDLEPILGGNDVIRIEVEDQGPGLSDDDKKKLFQKFARLSARPTGGEHSTGLGLSIVKKMVEAMNGRIWCQSEYGQGAKFIVALPAYHALPLSPNRSAFGGASEGLSSGESLVSSYSSYSSHSGGVMRVPLEKNMHHLGDGVVMGETNDNSR